MITEMDIWFEEPENELIACEDCVNPNGCIRECKIQALLQEDVAGIRGENL